jgi:catecholate siderophore receptor
MTLRLTPIAATLAAAALPFTSVIAQEKQEPQKLPEVSIKAAADKNEFQPATSTIGGAEALRDIPQTVNVVNRAVLEAQAATSMTEALRNVPGITISAGEGGNIGDNINLRGFSARTDMFTDGFRDRGQYVRDPFFIEAVEVLKGSSSMLFGRGSTGGVINQVSKRPGRDPITDVSLSVGTDTHVRSTFDINRAMSETSAVRVAGVGMHSESTRDVVKTERFGLAPSLAFGLGEPTTVTIQALLQKGEDIPDYGVPLMNFGPGTTARPIAAKRNAYYGFTDDRNDQSVIMINGSVRHKLSKDTSIANRTQYSRNRTIASPTPLGAASVIGGGTPSQLIPLTQMTALLSTRDRVVNDISLYNQTSLNTKLAHGAVVHHIAAGLEFGRDDSDVDNFTWTGLGSINLGAPVSTAKPSTAKRAANTVVTSVVDSTAVFVNDQIDLNKQWKLVAGIRWDRLTADYESRVVATGVTTKLDRTDEVFSKRVGVIYQPNDVQSYYASFGTSFNPSAEAVTLSASNADIAPEKNRSMEIGAKLDLLDGGLTVNGALFRVEKDGRTTDPLTATVQLTGETRVQGFEIGVVGRITPALQLMAGYTFLDGKIVSSKNRTGAGTAASPYLYAQGKTLQNTPKHNATAWATYTVGAWEAGGGLVYATDRFVNNFESAVIDGYTRLDASIAYRQPKYVLRFNVQNLTDKEYFETASGGRATPVKGRSLVGSINYSF